MQDDRNGDQYIIIYINGKLETVKIDCDSNFALIKCKIRLCICLNGNKIRFHLFYISLKIELMKNSNERFLHFDEDNKILYLLSDIYLIVKYFENFYKQAIHS